MTLEAAALALPLRPSGPKQSHSDKGLLEDPSLLTQLSWKDSPGGLILEEKGVDLLEILPIR